MYICLDCGEVFSQPRRYKETHGLESPPYEIFYVCPCCGGDYTETYQCDECGDWITGKYIRTDSGQTICDNCYCTYEIGEEDF